MVMILLDDDPIDEGFMDMALMCAGTIAGANDGVGITGVAYDAKIMPIKVLWVYWSCKWSTSWIVAGMRWAVDNGADIINMSLGGSWPNHQFICLL